MSEDIDFLAAELDRVQEGWDAAKDEIDGLRARVAELEKERDEARAERDSHVAAYRELRLNAARLVGERAVIDAAKAFVMASKPIREEMAPEDIVEREQVAIYDALAAAVDAMGTAQRDGREAA